MIGSNGNQTKDPIVSHLKSAEFHDLDESLLGHGEFSSFYWRVSGFTWDTINITLMSAFDTPLCEVDIFAFQGSVTYLQHLFKFK